MIVAHVMSGSYDQGIFHFRSSASNKFFLLWFEDTAVGLPSLQRSVGEYQVFKIGIFMCGGGHHSSSVLGVLNVFAEE